MENSLTSDLSLFENQDLVKNPFIYKSYQAEDTFSLGSLFSRRLEKGSVVALNGPLGAGKTCFVKGIASGLGIKDEVKSPTYTIISEYEGKLCSKTTIPIYHIDAYRLNGIEDFNAIGGEEILYGSGISIIEWADRIAGIIPVKVFLVNIEISGDNIGTFNRVARKYNVDK